MLRKLHTRRNCCYNDHNSDIKYLRSASKEEFESKPIELSRSFFKWGDR